MRTQSITEFMDKTAQNIKKYMYNIKQAESVINESSGGIQGGIE
jgi:hypothetical protein